LLVVRVASSRGFGEKASTLNWGGKCTLGLETTWEDSFENLILGGTKREISRFGNRYERKGHGIRFKHDQPENQMRMTSKKGKEEKDLREDLKDKHNGNVGNKNRLEVPLQIDSPVMMGRGLQSYACWGQEEGGSTVTRAFTGRSQTQSYQAQSYRFLSGRGREW